MRLLSIGCLLLSVWPAQAQEDFGFAAIDSLLSEAQTHAAAAAAADDMDAVRQHADGVFAAIWGQRSGLAGGRRGAAAMHGWKTRWQTTGAEFDADHVARHGDAPPREPRTDRLGIVGRARALRSELVARLDADSSQVHLAHVIDAINNVVGWMRLDDGVTKGENQPRVDLTYMWDAPGDFWNSSADTGWIHEAFAQALNILKTDYEGNVVLARSHAAAMVSILERCRTGVDADGDGTIAPVLMEGGWDTALAHADYAGLSR